MLTLDERAPHIAYAFRAGKFVIHKTDRHFSGMAFDQAHQQANAVIKGDGGAIGITEDPSALRRWMVAGPLVSHLVANYEEVSGVKVETEKRHHEKSPTYQKSFLDNVKKMTNTLEEMGNPFQEETGNLLSLDTRILRLRRVLRGFLHMFHLG